MLPILKAAYWISLLSLKEWACSSCSARCPMHSVRSCACVGAWGERACMCKCATQKHAPRTRTRTHARTLAPGTCFIHTHIHQYAHADSCFSRASLATGQPDDSEPDDHRAWRQRVVAEPRQKFSRVSVQLYLLRIESLTFENVWHRTATHEIIRNGSHRSWPRLSLCP
jgi:hypothetical protein